MYTQFSSLRELGRSAAFAVILFVFVMPIVIYNAQTAQATEGGALMSAVMPVDLPIDDEAKTELRQGRAKPDRDMLGAPSDG